MEKKFSCLHLFGNKPDLDLHLDDFSVTDGIPVLVTSLSEGM
jgi:hypothetical protein